MARSYTLRPVDGSKLRVDGRPNQPSTLNPQPPTRPHRYPTRNAVPLANVQKAELSILAREAFEQRGGECKLGPADDWRRDQVHIATGKHGLTACEQRDYLSIKAHFLALKGDTGRAMNAHLASEAEPRRIAAFKLMEAIKANNLTLGYAEAISRRQFKHTVAECSAKQLWNLTYTINNRGGAKRRAK